MGSEADIAIIDRYRRQLAALRTERKMQEARKRQIVSMLCERNDHEVEQQALRAELLKVTADADALRAVARDAIADADALRADLAKVTAERDEARAEVRRRDEERRRAGAGRNIGVSVEDHPSPDDSRTLVPRLLDEVERLRRELSEAHDIANDQIRQRTNLAAFVEGEAWRMAALRAVLADAMALLDTVNPDYSRDEWERLANRIAALKSKVAP